MPKKQLLALGDKEAYDPKALKNFTEKELRAEYSRLRSIAQKRLKNFEGSEWISSEVYKRNKGAYPTLANIKSKAQLARKLSDLASFVDAKTSTVTGLKQQRRRAIESLRDQGYTFINKSNFNDFVEFMDEMRSKNKRFGSPTPEELETLLIGRKKGIPAGELMEDFDFFIENRKTLSKINFKEKGIKYSADAYRQAIQASNYKKLKRNK